MSVRHAISEDRLHVVGLLRESHEAAGFVEPYSPAHAELMFKLHTSRPEGCCIVLEDDNKVLGILMAAYSEHPFGFGRWAKETVFYISHKARGKRGWLKMIEAYHSWAKDCGCVKVGMASLKSNDVSSLYTRIGYVEAETHYIKDVA